MRALPVALAAVFAFLMACPSRAAEKPRSQQRNHISPTKVWSNEDMGELRSRGLISIVGPEVRAESTQPAATAPTSEPSSSGYASHLEDPDWYAEKAAELQTELDRRTATLQEHQKALALASDRVTQPGIAMDQPSAVTPAEGIAMLTARVQELQAQLDELSDLARQNGIPPGVLRS